MEITLGHEVTEAASVGKILTAIVLLLQELLVSLVDEPLLLPCHAVERKGIHHILMMVGPQLMISLRLKMKMMKEMCLLSQLR